MDYNVLEELKIEVTYKCPLECIHCSSCANNENSLFISKEKCFEIIKQASSMGVKKIAFSGGEPLYWDGICEAVSLCDELGIATTIYTSGNCENIDDMFTKLSMANLNKAIFSVYSPKKEEHIRVTRKRDSFDNTLKAIAICRKNKITPEIHFVALASNYKKLSDVVALAKKIGVKRVSVLRFVPQGRGTLIKQKDTLTLEQNKELIDIIKNIRDSGFEIRTGSPFNVLLLNKEPKCMAARDRMIIAPDLSTYPCDAFKQIDASEITTHPKSCSLNNTTLKECWENSSYFNAVRKAVMSPVEEPCLSCGLYHQCGSGCLAQKFLKYKTLDSHRDPACLRIGAKK